MSAFHELAQEEQVARLSQLAGAALRAWAIGEGRVELIKYRENAVFAVTADDGGRFAMRVHRPRYRSDAEIRSEIEWMADLSRSGVPTPEIVRTRDGDVLSIAESVGVPEPRQCDLFRWVDGEPLGSFEQGVGGEDEAVLRTYRTVGELAARVHDHAAKWARPEGFARPEWDADALVGDDPAFGRFWELDCLSEDQLRVLVQAREETRERLEAFGRTSDRYGLIHGDFLPENLLVGTAGPQLIDFDDCGDGWYVFELATGVFALQAQANFAAVCRAYVEGYRSVRELPDEQLELLPTLLMARGLSYLGWPAGRPEMQEAQQVAPILAEMVSTLARRYLDDEPLGAPS